MVSGDRERAWHASLQTEGFGILTGEGDVSSMRKIIVAFGLHPDRYILPSLKSLRSPSPPSCLSPCSLNSGNQLSADKEGCGNIYDIRLVAPDNPYVDSGTLSYLILDLILLQGAA